MKTFSICATVSGGKYLGEIEAETPQEAIEKALATAYVSLCHRCADECSDPTITHVVAETKDADGNYQVYEEEL